MEWRVSEEDRITAATDVITPFGTVRLCWRQEEIFRVKIGPFDPADRRTTVRRYMPPHEQGQKLIAQFLAYVQGKPTVFGYELPSRLGTDFQRGVWHSLRAIPYGAFETYGDLALRLNLPARTARTIGSACGQNPLPIIYPCHRVVASTGALTGFVAGVAWKKALLQLEGVPIQHERVRVFRNR